MWVTNFILVQGLHLPILRAPAWGGFVPKTLITWPKDKMGNGDWLRSQTEHVVMAVRGKPVVEPDDITQGAVSSRAEERAFRQAEGILRLCGKALPRPAPALRRPCKYYVLASSNPFYRVGWPGQEFLAMTRAGGRGLG
jgi:N6-adenosine-specific RNA methylase IME4